MNNIEILYQDSEVLVVNKPAGLLVHADGSSVGPTLVDWVLEYYPELENIGEEQRLKNGDLIKRPGIVHRLDRDTSGVIMIAKTQPSYESLKQQFKDHVIKKAYLAVVYGNFKDDKDKGVIDLPIGRSPNNFRRWSAQPGARGQLREAKTEYFVLEQIPGYSLLFLQPYTGRTHQLRVHLKALHHPIVCDSLYAPKYGCLNGIKRQALHARAITWENKQGLLQQITAPLPSDFASAIQKIGFKYKT